MQQRYFLIVGNGRTGSTWLLTNFDRLPDTTARFELKWASDAQRADAHRTLGLGTNATAAISGAAIAPSKQASILGSKLILNPYSYYGPKTFSEIGNALDGDIKLILLKRKYKQTWLSWKARGVYHKVDETVPTADAQSNPLLDAMRSMDEPPKQHLVLHHNGPLDVFPGAPYPLVTAIDDIIQNYANDIQFLRILKNKTGVVVYYDDIEREFSKLAKFVGSRAAPSDIADIVAKPQTLLLERLDSFLHPGDGLDAISIAFDNAFALAAAGAIDLDSALTWNESGLLINVPAVENVLKPLHLGAARFDKGGGMHWTPQRPMLP